MAVWLVREQVAMAAMDVGDTHLAATCVKAISREFPESMRAQRLQVQSTILRACLQHSRLMRLSAGAGDVFRVHGQLGSR